jgi:hypothetical protein
VIKVRSRGGIGVDRGRAISLRGRSTLMNFKHTTVEQREALIPEIENRTDEELAAEIAGLRARVRWENK